MRRPALYSVSPCRSRINRRTIGVSRSTLVSPASGSRFSVIPPENATGNFTRIVQRVPVKIVLDRPLPEGVHLTPGISADVRVDLRRQPGE